MKLKVVLNMYKPLKSMALNRLAVCFILIALVTTVYAQENRYVVFFKDKQGTVYSVDNPSAFLGERAIERRSKQGIAITEQDFPVNSNYVQDVKSLSVTVFYSTRWMNGILVQCDASKIPDIEALSSVDHVELVAPGAKPLSSGRKKFITHRASQSAVPVTYTQLNMLGMEDMHLAGYHGEGVSIAVLDAGFPGVNLTEAFQPVFTEGRFNDSVSYDFVHGDQNVFQSVEHGTEVLSTIAAYLAGTFVGGAYKANFQLYITEDDDTEYRIEEYNWLLAAERADSAGVDIINSSLGYNTFDLSSMNYSKSDLDGETAVITRAAQWAAERGVLVVVSAGNEGSNSWGTITTPADADDVLAVGAVNSNRERSSISSTGPSADGRIKPDVAAMGIATAVIRGNGNGTFLNGTSFAAPLIAALAAGIWQKYPDLTNLELMDIIKQSASQAASPDNLLGYGIPNFVAVVNKMEWQPQLEKVVIYPNPIVSDALTISPSDPDEISTCLVEIISLQGQVIATQQVAFDWVKRTYIANCETLTPGMYFLRATLGKDIYAFKIVKL